MTRKTGDYLAWGLILISVSFFFLLWRQPNDLFKYMGLAGCIITFIVEATYLRDSWIN